MSVAAKGVHFPFLFGLPSVIRSCATTSRKRATPICDQKLKLKFSSQGSTIKDDLSLATAITLGCYGCVICGHEF